MREYLYSGGVFLERAIVALLCLLVTGALSAQVRTEAEDARVWQVPLSTSTIPHFERENGHPVLYVDGEPFIALASELPWWNLQAGRYRETENDLDYLYPAAAKMGLNTLKVPVKWSTVEPQKGVYDFSYIDHIEKMAEKNHLKIVINWLGHFASGDGNIYLNLTSGQFAPYYIIEDETTYLRAIDADGILHHNAISYEYDAVIQREIKAFRALMEHIKQVDATDRTIIMIQVENEISVFGADRTNRKLWRDHTPEANQTFQQHGFNDDLKYSAWRLSKHWLQPLTEGGAQIYPIPFELNFVAGTLEEGIVGGAPGEDVATYLNNCPRVSFIGLNLYTNPDTTVEEFRQSLQRYGIGRNIPSLTETNSANDGVAPRAAYIAIGEFASPLFSPWALNVSSPAPDSPYVTENGALTNGALALQSTYSSLSKALPQIAYYAGTDKLKVFMASSPGKKFSETQQVNGMTITVTGEGDGKAIVIHPSGHDLLLVGFHCGVTVDKIDLRWPAMKALELKKVRWAKTGWVEEGEPAYGVDQSHGSLHIDLDEPEAVRISW